MIIRSGHNIDPLMIENAMAAHPAVALAAAVGMPDGYAGELPVCYVALRPAPGPARRAARAAQRTIGERPAWPKEIHIIDAIPLTSVGKIYKPQLRCDAAARLVTRVVREQLALPDARVQVSEGGRRGMRVSVTLPQASRPSVPAVQQSFGGVSVRGASHGRVATESRGCATGQTTAESVRLDRRTTRAMHRR